MAAGKALRLLACLLLLGTAAAEPDKNTLLQRFNELCKARQYQQALEPGRQLLKIYQGENVRGQTAICLANLAGLYRQLGQLDQTVALYEQALPLLDEADPDTLKMLGRLSQAYTELGRYSQAEPLLERQLRALEKAHGAESSQVAGALNNLALLLKFRGADAQAHNLYSRALAIQEKLNDPAMLSTLTNLAALQQNAGRYAEAEALLRRAQSLPHTPLQESIVLTHLGVVYDRQNRYEQAETAYRQGLSLRENRQDSESGVLLNNLALLLLQQGRAAEAEPLLEKALQIFKRHPSSDHGGVVNLENLAWLKRALQKPDEALQLARQAQGERQARLADVLSFTGEADRLAYRRLASPYSLLASLGSAPDLAEAVLRQKGIVLDSLIEDLRLGQDLPLARQLRAQRQAQSQLACGSPEYLAGRRQIQKLEAELARSLTAAGMTRRALGVTVAEVQRALPPKTVLLEFLKYDSYRDGKLFGNYYGAILLTREDPPRWVPLGPAEELERSVQTYQAAVHAGVLRSSHLQKLQQRLWQPLQQVVPKDTRTVIISPDGTVNFVSFATLLTPEEKFLCQQYTFLYVASGRDLLQKPQLSKSHSWVGLGNPDFGAAGSLPPLPGSQLECRSLAELARQAGYQSQLLLAGEASEKRLRGLHSPTILHLATHGLWASPPGVSNPMQRGCLALAGAQKTVDSWEQPGPAIPSAGDGILSAEEVSTLDLKGTWLVAMSACDSGQGKALQGEGVLGLRRGFVQAGTTNLLLTLWPIADEETAAFMADFYRRALRTGQPALALAHTQRDWLVRLSSQKGPAAAAALAGPFLVSFQGPPDRQLK